MCLAHAPVLKNRPRSARNPNAPAAPRSKSSKVALIWISPITRPEGSDTALALAEMKRVEPSFGVSDFLGGARGAYEMIVMGYEHGNLDEIKPFLSEDIYESFVEGVAAREDQGLTVESHFIGIREMELENATMDKTTNEAELTIRFVAELTSVVKDRDGEIVEGSTTEVNRQKDTWVFARVMGSDDPNWLLVSTDG